jgi:hypothetical protein
MHPFLKIGGIYPFLYAKVTHTHSTPLFSHNFILLNAPHVCSHLLFPELVTFHSPTEHKNGTNPFHILAQTEHKNGTNPFFWNGTMTLHSTWFSNRTHPLYGYTSDINSRCGTSLFIKAKFLLELNYHIHKPVLNL